MARRIKKANIRFISLVPAGANKLRPVYKSDDQTVTFGAVVKAAPDFDEHGELTAVVYAPNHRDSQGDIADSQVVKQMSYDFIANGAEIDIRHDGKPVAKDRARVAETFLVQKSDERFHGWKDTEEQPIDLTGAWATVIKIDDPELRKKYRSGEWAGVSMGGTAIVEQEKAASLEDLVAALSKAMTSAQKQTPTAEDDTMTPEQLAELKKTFADGITAMGVELAKALKPAAPEKTAEQVAKEAADAKAAADAAEAAKNQKPAPVFKGVLTNAADVRAHALNVQLFHLEKSLDFNNQASVDAFLEKSAEVAEELAELQDYVTKPVERHRTVRKAGPGADAAPGGFQADSVPSFLQVMPMTKGESNAMAAAAALASEMNKQRLGVKG